MAERNAEAFWLDLAIRHAILLSRLQEGEARRIERILRDAFDELAAKTLVRLGGGFKTRGPFGLHEKSRALRDLVEKAEAAIGGAYSAALAEAKSALREAAAYEAAWSARTLDRVLPADFGIQAVSLPLLRSIAVSRPFQGALLKDWWRGLDLETRAVYRRAVSRGLTLGESNAAIAERVSRALGMKAQQVAAVTRTAVRHVTAHARMATFLANSHIVNGVIWISTLDARTTPVCISLDGREFPLDSGPRPPQHFG